MDPNTPREDATGAQPPADANQSAPEQPQAAGQEAAAEYAAWSADSTYQQQQGQQPQGQQPADTQAYAAPEPQSATYTDPQAQQQAYDQQQQAAYDQQQQAAYQQQQAAYDQQQQAAYQQQQAAYQQQQAAYQQQQYDQQQGQQPPAQQQYDQQAYQQPPAQQQYDQQAYQQQYQQYYAQQAQQQQQPGYYDQQGQQGYQQPYAYGQPGQQQPWPGDAQHWEEGGSRYGRSFIAVLGGFALLTWGLVIAMVGGLLLWTNDLLGHIQDVTLSEDVVEIVERMDEQVVAWGGILLILGIMHLIGAVGILAHRKWGRAFGIVLGLLGFLFGLSIIFSAIGWELLDGAAFDTVLTGEEASVGAGIFVAGTYLLVLLGMFVGRRHFKKKGVEA